MNAKPHEDNKEITPLAPHIALFGVQVLFGSLPVIGKVILNVIPPLALVGFRVGITTIVLFVVQMFRGGIWLRDRSDYPKLAILSIFGISLNQMLFISGLSLTKAANTSLLAVTIPIFTIIVSAAAGSERLKGIKVMGIILAAAGVVILIDPRNASFSSQSTLGDTLIVLNSLSYGIYVATSKSVITRNGAFRSMMWVFLFASIVCVPIGAFSLTSVPLANVSPMVWWLIVYVAVAATAGPYLLNAFALARVDPSIVAVYVYAQPLIGFVLAVILLNEHIGPSFLLAAAFVFSGVFLTTRRRPLK